MTDLLSRRQAIAMLAGGAVATHPRIASATPEASLGSIAAGHGIRFGASAGPPIFSDAAYRNLYRTQTRIITTDVALKIGAIAPRPGAKQFKRGDRLLAFCDDNAIPMRGHCLIWNEWVPAWIKSMSTAERRTYFDAYIDEVVTHYASRLHSWDVVNEPFWPSHHAPGGFRLGPWYDAFGPDYVQRAFVRAAKADAKTRLVLNEAQTERDDELGHAVRRGLLKLVADLKHAGVRLDAVGLQGHLQPPYPHDAARFAEFLHALADLGVDIYITEFDVRDDTFADDIAARDRQVADTAKAFLDAVLAVPAVKIVIAWQLADKYSFYRGIWEHKHPDSPRRPRPLPYDEDLRRKPLWTAMAGSFKRERSHTPAKARP